MPHRRPELADYEQSIHLCVVDHDANAGMRGYHVPPPLLACTKYQSSKSDPANVIYNVTACGACVSPQVVVFMATV